MVAKGGLGDALIEPALRALRARGVEPRFGARLREFAFEESRVAALRFGDTEAALEKGDAVVLAAPPWIAEELVPGLVAPNDFRAILNAHFKIAPPEGQPLLLGMIGTLTEWLFAFDDRLSVTISGADRLIDDSREALAENIWAEVSAATGLPPALPPWQIVKEKRATFAATPAQEKRRPDAKTAWDNLWLAGDWTNTGLPATIEGSIRSGYKAAEIASNGKVSRLG
jgi:phytoene dehydrogenase-like protein